MRKRSSGLATNDIIRQYITTELATEGKEVSDTDLLVEDGIIDSFAIMSLLSFLEERFQIQIGGDELLPENFQSVAALTAMVERKTG
jgi:D-alanine--poly(phosphoribitol) ligase subunit 2